MSTGDPIIPPPPCFDETPPPPSKSHEDILPRPLRSTRLHHSERHRPQNIPTIPSVAKRRSGTLHLENPVSKRWRSDTSYPETPVPTTASSQLRWRAGDLRALRPFRRLRGKQRDPSEVSAKRPRLAPAQVISTALTKSCDWSLGVAERSHTFGEITKDWSHSIFLTGRAARKEVHFASVSPEKQRLLLGAMAREWKKWEEHKAALPLTQGELRMLKSRFPSLSQNCWHPLVLTPKEPDFKTRLVVQGCQEDPSMMRTDSPTGSFFLVLCCAAQEALE